MASQSSNNLAAYSWSIADLLRGDFKQSQYGRIILPFTLLRRLECVLAPSKPKVLAEVDKLAKQKLPEEAREKLLLRATGRLSFFNTSRMDLGTLGESGIKANLDSYVDAFSKDAREIFEYFNFSEFVGQLNDANLLYKVVQRVRLSDLSPSAVSNHEMGLVFEELIRRFAESSNETAGEHFTPRDIVRLTTSLVFMEDDDALTKPGIIRTIYDPTAGTGGFLSSGMEYVHELNPRAVMRAFGQELNPESYAICKADMLIKGQDVSNIKLGNTLSADQLHAQKFDYMLSNPPFGVDWKKIEGDITREHTLKGFDGRFGPGLPRVSDGSLLFLLHLLSKMRSPAPSGLPAEASAKAGARIGIILNGSPLFTGGAGSGESEIRRHLLESDLLEAIVALPTDMFYNTGIATYVWILSNKKAADRKGRVQLINGVHLHGKMRKSLGSKRHEMSDDHIKTITRAFGDFAAITPQPLDAPAEAKSTRGRKAANPTAEPEKTFSAKLFPTHAFGYLAGEGEEGLPLIKMGNLGRGDIKLDHVEYISTRAPFEKCHLLKRGDFLFNTRNSLDLVGKVSVWREELAKALYNSNILRIEFRKDFVDASSYMNYLFNSDLGISLLRLVAKGTTSVAAIYYKELTSLVIPLPPANEQSAIVSFLETKLISFGRLIEIAESAVTLLQERRTALISAAVTGKIDVRHWQPPVVSESGTTAHATA